MHTAITWFGLFVFAELWLPTGSLLPDHYDLIIENGELIDGLDRPRYRADLGIRGGRIAAIGDLRNQRSERRIDAKGMIVAPGFIDLHSHAEAGLTSKDPRRRAAPNLVTQGITTVVVNQDGGGPASVTDQSQQMERLGIGINAIQMVGHGTVRRKVMREDFRRPAKSAEVSRMRRLLGDGMRNGAFGLSAGLEYVPGRWSTFEEMKALAEEVARLGGVYIVHERSSGSRPMWFLPSQDDPNQPSMLDNIRELIEIGSTTGVTVVATHIKARGVDFWGSSKTMVGMIRAARSEGTRLFADQYPYNTSGSDGKIVLIPRWSRDGARPPAELLESALKDPARATQLRQDIAYEIKRRGGPASILVLDHPDAKLIGKSLEELGESLGGDAVEAAIRLQTEGDRKRPGGARLRAFSMSEQDVELFASMPWTATSSDAGIALPEDGPVHPRFYGAFARKIRVYALERKLLSLEQAVRSSTSLPASILGLADRGKLAPKTVADVVVFDPLEIRDMADAFQPHQFCQGIHYVIVAGKLVVDGGTLGNKLPGVVIRRQSGRTDN